MGFVLGCGGGCFLLFVVLLVGSGLVRAAVALANRVLGPAEPPDTFGRWDDWDSDDEPVYAARRGADRAVPEPSIATGMLVTFLSGLFTVGGYAVAVFFAQQLLDDLDRSDEWVLVALALGGLPVGFVAHAFLLGLLLPTTFGRAALVAFFHVLIVAAIALTFVAAVYLVLGPW